MGLPPRGPGQEPYVGLGMLVLAFSCDGGRYGLYGFALERCGTTGYGSTLRQTTKKDTSVNARPQRIISTLRTGSRSSPATRSTWPQTWQRLLECRTSQ